jgi:hypothetical protein
VSGSCPVCASDSAEVFLARAGVPVQQNLPVDSPEAAAAIPRGSLRMAVCANCGFVFNGAFEPELMEYGPGYNNDQTHSPAFRTHLDERLRHLVDERGVRGKRIVEVGCGNGAFLRKVVRADPGNVGYGFDPAYRGPLHEEQGRLNFARSLYGPEHTGLRADVVICRHVIEHVPRPLALLQAVRAAIVEAPSSRVFFETPCVDWILRNRVLWDFFYEHCSLFTTASLRTAFELAGFEVRSVQHVFGDQYLWIEAVPASSPAAATLAPGETPSLAFGYGAGEAATLAEWRARLAGWASLGSFAVWGAGAKGVTLLNLVDPARELVDCVVDLNPLKQGRYVPGTGHPVVAPGMLAARGVRRALMMNPNYRAETQALLDGAGLQVELVD